jgi:hypothetical protein
MSAAETSNIGRIILTDYTAQGVASTVDKLLSYETRSIVDVLM